MVNEMVRKKIAVIATVITLLASNTIYPATGIITALDEEADIVQVTKANGMHYEFEGIEDLQVGDVVSLLMYNAGDTKSAADDEIISARYSGYTAGDLN